MDTPTTPPATLSPKEDSNYLSHELAESIAIRELLRDGLTAAQAADALKISRSTLFRRLRLLEDDAPLAAAKLLSIKALELSEHWLQAAKVAADKGDHRPARDALLHARAIEPVAGDQGSGARVNIIIGTPEHPIPEPIPILAPLDVVVDTL